MPLVSIDCKCAIAISRRSARRRPTDAPLSMSACSSASARIVNDSDGILTFGAGALISAGAVVTHSVGGGSEARRQPGARVAFARRRAQDATLKALPPTPVYRLSLPRAARGRAKNERVHAAVGNLTFDDRGVVV